MNFISITTEPQTTKNTYTNFEPTSSLFDKDIIKRLFSVNYEDDGKE